VTVNRIICVSFVFVSCLVSCLIVRCGQHRVRKHSSSVLQVNQDGEDRPDHQGAEVISVTMASLE